MSQHIHWDPNLLFLLSLNWMEARDRRNGNARLLLDYLDQKIIDAMTEDDFNRFTSLRIAVQNVLDRNRIQFQRQNPRRRRQQ